MAACERHGCGCDFVQAQGPQQNSNFVAREAWEYMKGHPKGHGLFFFQDVYTNLFFFPKKDRQKGPWHAFCICFQAQKNARANLFMPPSCSLDKSSYSSGATSVATKTASNEGCPRAVPHPSPKEEVVQGNASSSGALAKLDAAEATNKKPKPPRRMMYTGVTAGLFKFKYRTGSNGAGKDDDDSVTKSMQLVEKAEAKTKKFFTYIVELIQKVKGIDLTVRGYSVLGHGLQMLALEDDDEFEDEENDKGHAEKKSKKRKKCDDQESDSDQDSDSDSSSSSSSSSSSDSSSSSSGSSDSSYEEDEDDDDISESEKEESDDEEGEGEIEEINSSSDSESDSSSSCSSSSSSGCSSASESDSDDSHNAESLDSEASDADQESTPRDKHHAKRVASPPKKKKKRHDENA